MIEKRGKADERAAEQAHDSPAEQAHEKRAFERQVQKLVPKNAQHHANRQRRRQTQQQHHLLIGIAVSREDKLAERCEAHQQCRPPGPPPPPTFRTSVNSRSRPSRNAPTSPIIRCNGDPDANLANAAGDIKRRRPVVAHLGSDYAVGFRASLTLED